MQFPEWSKDAVIYEVNVRQYTEEGTFKAFEGHLSRLKQLGVKILWFMPIHPISKLKRNGTLGSYYAVADYKDVNSEFGTIDEFKHLMAKAHDLGFKVLLDWVANHTGWDHPWIGEHPDWYIRDDSGAILHPPGTNWLDVAKLNYENQDMRAAMLDALVFWVKACDVDGYRADHAQGVPADFWEVARNELDKIKPVYMLAEVEGHYNLLEKAFHSDYGWKFHGVMNDLAQGKAKSEAIKSYFENAAANYPKGTYPMQFITNHDENSSNGTEFERLGDAVKAMAVLSFTVPGIPLIYSGQEAGLNKRLEFFEKDEIPWDDLSMQAFYEDLILYKQTNQALRNGSAGGWIEFLETSDQRLLAFERKKETNRVLVVMNGSAESVKGAVSVPVNTYHDLDPEYIFDFGPWGYDIFTKK